LLQPIGMTLGPYRILERIGRGGMATVHKAYQPALDRYVALKVLPAHLTDEPGFAERFRREARAVAKLEHPHILPIHDYGQEGELTYIAMRYVEGGTLKDLLGKPLELRLIVDLIGQIGGALDHAHEHGIVHRDVKPSNVLLDRGNWALLTDFGVARMVEATQELTGTGVGVGTPAYMSPEQGQGKKVDRRSDVYSLGVVLYEMLTGRVPFEAETPLAVVWKHVNEPLPLPRSINPEIPEAVERVVLKTMAKGPVDRFEKASLLASALRDAMLRPARSIVQLITELFARRARVRETELAPLREKIRRYWWVIPTVAIAAFVVFRTTNLVRTVSPVPEAFAPEPSAQTTESLEAQSAPPSSVPAPAEGPKSTLAQAHVATQSPTAAVNALVPAATSFFDSPFTVRADLDWQDTGVEVHPGGIIEVSYLSGTWTTFEGVHPRVSATGNEELGDPKNPNHPLPSAYPGVLIGRVGNNPIQEIGAELRFQAEKGGRLFLRMNDDYMADNEGSLLVSISLLPEPALLDDFNDTVYDGAFNDTRWGYWPDVDLAILNVHQEDGVLRFDRTSSSSEVDRVLFARAENNAIGDLSYFEARLRLGGDPTGAHAFVKIQLTANLGSRGWWTQCRLNGYGSRPPDFVCDAFTHENGDFVNEFLSDPTPIEYDVWYTVRIEIDPNSGRIDYLLDGESVGTYVPQTLETLMASSANVQIGVWQQANSSVVGHIDDVLLGELGDTD